MGVANFAGGGEGPSVDFELDVPRKVTECQTVNFKLDLLRKVAD